jgi:polysaccharide biosynthesis transport protein
MAELYQEKHLRDYLKVISKRRWAAIIFLVITFTLVAVHTFSTTPQYEGTAKVLLERVEPNDLLARSRYGGNDPSFYETQYQLIRSRAVARRVVEMLSLEDDFEIFLGHWQKTIPVTDALKSSLIGAVHRILSKFRGAKGQEEEGNSPGSREEWLAGAISSQIKVRPVADSRIVHISYLFPQPEFAALVANTVARAYIEETLELKMDSTRRTLEWMTRKAGEEAQKLEKAEMALHDYMRAHNIITLENRLAGTPEEFAEISTQLMRAESHRRQMETLNSIIREVQKGTQQPETVAAIAADPALQTLRSQIVLAEKSIMELSGRYGPKHPLMEKAVGDLKVLEQKRQQEIDRIVQSIRNEYELARSNENNLRAQFDKIKAEALRLNDRSVQYGILKREVDTNRQLYDALMLKIKEQSITDETNPINLWIVEEARIPGAPATPLKGFNLVIGLTLGLFGGIGLAFFLDYLDNTIKSPAEVEAVLGIPVLGVITFSKEKEGLEKTILRAPSSVMAENYKGLRTSLLLSSADRPPQKILITSAIAGEGKTTTAVNLAMALALAGKRVVLIDGDLRRPRIHKIFKQNNHNGLSNFLAGATEGEILKKGPLPNLGLITSGPIPPNPSELLISSRMALLLEQLSQNFDIIICDSPPILTVSDSRILGRQFDGTVLVTLAHRIPFEVAGRAVKLLHDSHAPILGMVLNGLNVKKGDYYDYYTAYREEPLPGTEKPAPGFRS